MESATSAVNWRPHNTAKDPGALRVDSYSALARGSDGICFFQFRQSAFGAERFHSAVVPLAGADTRVFREAAALGSGLQELRFLAGEPAPAPIAILFDWDSWWAAEAPDCPSDRLAVLDQLQAYHRQLLRRGLSAEVVHPGTDLDRFSLVLVPSLFLLRDDHAARLAGWVERGGSAVVGPFSGVADGNGHLRQGRFPSVLAGMLGASGEEWRPLAGPVGLDFGAAPARAEHPARRPRCTWLRPFPGRLAWPRPAGPRTCAWTRREPPPWPRSRKGPWPENPRWSATATAAAPPGTPGRTCRTPPWRSWWGTRWLPPAWPHRWLANCLPTSNLPPAEPAISC